MGTIVNICLLVLFNTLQVFGETLNEQDFILCATTVGSIARFGEDGGPEEISTELPYQKCEKNYCYTLWQEDPKNGSVVIMGQGIFLKILRNICIHTKFLSTI